MVKINFQNNVTKCNADTFNTLQDNIEDAITDENILLTNYVDNKLTYSTDEKVVGTWIDGKPLYRKTIVFPNGNSGTLTPVTYTLSNYNISNVDNIFVVHPSYYSMGDRHYPFQYNDGTDFACNVSTTTLNITLGYAPISNSEFVITLEYTKTTN